MIWIYALQIKIKSRFLWLFITKFGDVLEYFCSMFYFNFDLLVLFSFFSCWFQLNPRELRMETTTKKRTRNTKKKINVNSSSWIYLKAMRCGMVLVASGREWDGNREIMVHISKEIKWYSKPKWNAIEFITHGHY